MSEWIFQKAIVWSAHPLLFCSKIISLYISTFTLIYLSTYIPIYLYTSRELEDSSLSAYYLQDNGKSLSYIPLFYYIYSFYFLHQGYPAFMAQNKFLLYILVYISLSLLLPIYTISPLASLKSKLRVFYKYTNYTNSTSIQYISFYFSTSLLRSLSKIPFGSFLSHAINPYLYISTSTHLYISTSTLYRPLPFKVTLH